MHTSAVSVSQSDWEAVLDRLPPMPYGQPLASDSLSYHVVVIQDQPHGELRRFQEKFKEASEGLTNHCSDINAQRINMIALRVPATLHLSTSTQWVMEELQTGYHNHVTAVLITRFVILHENSRSSLALEHSFKANPNADVKWDDFFKQDETLHATLPVGKVLEKPTTPYLVMERADRGRAKVPLTSTYFYQKGRYIFDPGGRKADLPGIPNAEVGGIVRWFAGDEPQAALFTRRHPVRSEPLLL